MYFSTIITFSLIQLTLGFIAYDCNGPKINKTAFNSLSVDFCDLPTAINVKSIQRVQLLPKTDTYSIPYKSCSIITNSGEIIYLIKCKTVEVEIKY